MLFLRRTLELIGCVVVSGALLSFSAEALEPRTAQLIPVDPNHSIPGLTWQTEGLRVEADAKSPETTAYVFVEGELKQPDSSLLIRNVKIPVSEDGKFRLRVAATTRYTDLLARVIDAHGKVAAEAVRIDIPDWDSHREAIAMEKTGEKRLRMTAALGVSSVVYSETGMSDFSQVAITPKASLTYFITPRLWLIGLNAFFTALPLASTQQTSATFMGINLRAGLISPWPVKPWQFSFLAGAYYSTMFVSGNAFGYSSLLYPQLFPALRRYFGDNDSVGVYVKLVPTGKSAFDFSQRELASGVQWERILGGGHPLSVTLDVADLKFSPSSAKRIQSTSLTFGVEYGF